VAGGRWPVAGGRWPIGSAEGLTPRGSRCTSGFTSTAITGILRTGHELRLYGALVLRLRNRSQAA